MTSEFSFVPGGRNAAGAIGGGKDRLIDPRTKDFVRTANGEWEEVRNSQTAVLIAFEVELGTSPFDPGDGTTIKQRVRDGTLSSVDDLKAEAERLGVELTKAGIVSNFEASVRDANGEPFLDEDGHVVVQTQYRDLASGSPINTSFTVR